MTVGPGFRRRSGHATVTGVDRPRAHLASVLALWATGCVSELVLEPPPIAPETRSLLVAIAPEGGDVTELRAFDTSDGVPPRALLPLQAERSELWALLYAETLEALQLEPGPIALDGWTGPSRWLPRPGGVLLATLGDGAPGRWEETPAGSKILELRVPELDWLRCMEQGGCRAGEEPLCTLPCPEPPALDPPAPPEPPRPPAMPRFSAPCPAGWTALELDPDAPALWCRPPTLAEPCPDGQWQRPGTEGCDRLGAPCPIGQWPEAPAGRRVLYLRPGPTGGDGSEGAPFGSLAEAISRSAPGDVLALARGLYTSGATISHDLTVAGACPPETTLESPGGETGLHVSAGTLELSGVTLSGDRALGVSGPLGRVDATGVALYARGDGGTGPLVVAMDGATISIRASAIRRRTGPGALAEGGGALELLDVVVEAGSGPAVVARGGGSHARVERAIIFERPGAVHEPIGGAIEGGRLELVEVLLDAGQHTQLIGVEGGTLRIERSRLIGATPGAPAIAASEHGRLELREVELSGAPFVAATATSAISAIDVHFVAERTVASLADTGLVVHESSLEGDRVAFAGAPGTILTLADGGSAVVRDLSASANELPGPAEAIQVVRSRLHLERAEFSGVRAVILAGADGEIEATDLRVTSGGVAAGGLIAANHTRIEVERAVLQGLGAGIFLGSDSPATLRDVEISTQTTNGAAVWTESSPVDATRLLISSCGDLGISASASPLESASIVAEDLTVIGCPEFGASSGDGTLSLRRARFVDCGIGVNVGASGELFARDLSIERNQPTTQRTSGFVVNGARTVIVDGFSILRAGEAGLALFFPRYFADDGGTLRSELSFSRGEIAENGIGLRLTPGPDDLGPVFHQVRITDNGTPYERAEE